MISDGCLNDFTLSESFCAKSFIIKGLENEIIDDNLMK